VTEAERATQLIQWVGDRREEWGETD